MQARYPDERLLQVCDIAETGLYNSINFENKKDLSHKSAISPWRREWDSNPRGLFTQTVFKTAPL